MQRNISLLPRLAGLLLLSFAPWASGNALPEYRLKAAFLYNFALFTEWPAAVGPTLNLCVYGQNPFGAEIDGLEGKAVGARHIAVHRFTSVELLKTCQVVFIARSVADDLPTLLTQLRDLTVLTVADSPGAGDQGVALNMNIVNGKVTFEANLEAARGAQLNLSSKLLRLATKVHQ